MDREQVRRWESQCIQEQAPACTSACPMHVDARKIAECVRKGDFRSGYAALATSLERPYHSSLHRIDDFFWSGGINVLGIVQV
jgi:NADPH-dependent glutamate synthase beta subunit-like oxidoreductase